MHQQRLNQSLHHLISWVIRLYHKTPYQLVLKICRLTSLQTLISILRCCDQLDCHQIICLRHGFATVAMPPTPTKLAFVTDVTRLRELYLVEWDQPSLQLCPQFLPRAEAMPTQCSALPSTPQLHNLHHQTSESRTEPPPQFLPTHLSLRQAVASVLQVHTPASVVEGSLVATYASHVDKHTPQPHA